MLALQASAAAIARIIADYRAGEITAPDAAHVLRWVAQFPDSDRVALLQEMQHLLARSYFARADVTRWLTVQASNPALTGPKPSDFWPGVRFLRLQQAGNSQRDMLVLFDAILRTNIGSGVGTGGPDPHTYLYMDDFLYSGGRIRSDLSAWIAGFAPKRARLVILLIGLHRSGQWYTLNQLEAAAKKAGKAITIEWWRSIEVEDRLSRINGSDVLRPRSIPADPATQAYIAKLGEPPKLRQGDATGPLGLYTSSAGRHLLEQAFLIGGVEVRRRCLHFDQYMRPLGRMYFAQPGFGTPLVTYRNCPNNAPLVLWAGDPWYPLFPRKNN